MTSIELFGVTDTLSLDHEKYSTALKTVSDAVQEALELFNDPKFDSREDWKKEGENNGSTVHSKQIKQGKAFVLRGELPGTWEDNFGIQWNDVETFPEWNNNLVFSKIAHKLTENADIVHYANPDVMVVKSRDYTVARMKRVINGAGYIVARSIVLSELPDKKGHVRGHVHMGAGRIAPHPTKANTTVIDYIMCIDLKGMIPKSIVNSAMAKMMFQDFDQTQAHMKQKFSN